MLEASSHGLDQGRLNGINLKAGIFTNFSQDHMDYHKSMKNYLDSKLILFKKLLKKDNYIITDKSIPELKKIDKIVKKKKLKKIYIDFSKRNYDLNEFNPIGNFQKKNLTMAIKACEIIGLNKKKIFKCISKLKSVKGRLELVKEFPDKTRVFIDFAHTPDAINSAITSLKTHFKKDVTIVFGCGEKETKVKEKR